MNRTLASYPKEVLQNVAIYLNETDLNYSLYLCGSEALTYKIRQAVTDLRVIELKLAPERVKRLSFFQNARMLVLDTDPYQTTNVFTHVLKVMPSTLVHIHNPNSNALKAFEQPLSNEEAVDLSLVPHRNDRFTSTILSHRFPQLNYLHVGQNNHWSDPSEKWSEGMKIRFLAGLPRSLTHLHLALLNTIVVSPWSFLPPNLQRITSTCQVTPTKRTLSESLSSSLSDLHFSELDRPRRLTLKFDGTPIGTDEEAYKSYLEVAQFTTANFEMPRNLTRLNFSSQLLPPVAFPSTLKWLTWNFRQAILPDFDTVMSKVPISVTSLHLSQFSARDNNSLITISERPNIRSFALKDVAFRAERFAAPLFKALPNAEEMEIAFISHLEEDVLRLLNPATLTKLAAYLDPFLMASLVPSASSKELTLLFPTLFPKLTYLKLQCPTAHRGAAIFCCAALPPTLTELHVDYSVQATELLSLPASITKMAIQELVVSNNLSPMDFDRLFFPPNLDNKIPFHDTLHLSHTHMLQRVTIKPQQGSLEQPKEPFWLPSFPADRPGPPNLYDNVNILLKTTNLILTLPTTITHLSISTPVLLPEETFNQKALPVLKSFYYWSPTCVWVPQLENFESLEDLEFFCIPSRSFGRLPPNLTRIRIDRSWNLQMPLGAGTWNIDHLIQIPISIKHLEFEFIAPWSVFESQLPHLINLQTLLPGTQQAGLAKAIIERAVPPSLTKIHVNVSSNDFFTALDDKVLPHLRHIKYTGSFHPQQLDSILNAIGSDGTLDGGLLVRNYDPLQLTHMAGLDIPGSIKNGSDDTSANLGEFFSNVNRKSRPQWVRYYCYVSHSFTPSSWPQFALFLAPTLTYLDTSYCWVPPNFGSSLPPTLRTLKARMINAPQYRCTRHLPSGITDLTISATGFGVLTYAELPASLTTLALIDQRKFPPRFARVIPSTVTSLALGVHSCPAESFSHLPTSIARLELYYLPLRGRIIRKLPSHIKQLFAQNGRDPLRYIEMAAERGIPWIMWDNSAANSALEKKSIESLLPLMLERPY